MSKPTVTVACRLPHGLILRLFQMVEVSEAQAGGGSRSVKRAQPLPGAITIKGYLDKYSPALPPAARGSAYALTPGVDKEFFDEWMKQNKDHDAVVNQLIFASDKADTVTAMMRENDKRRSGLEPIDPSQLPRGVQTYKAEA